MAWSQTKKKLARGAFIRGASGAVLIAAFAAAAVLPLFAERSSAPKSAIDEVLRQAVEEKKVPGVVAMVVTGDKVTYEGAAGKRDTLHGAPMTADSIFRIASMTKAVTAVALMQLVESGRVNLDEAAATYVAELKDVQVLEGVDAGTKKATFRVPKTAPTVRQLLTHTSGFGYEFFDAKLHDYVASGAIPSMFQGSDGFLKAPLVFDPGTRWEYGISMDWAGRIVEKVSGQNLEAYFHQHIFEPLGMADTFYNVPAEKQARVAAVHMRQADGSYQEPPPQPIKATQEFFGGAGLYSTASDYMKFMRAILDGGKLGGKRILKAETVAQMSRNQVGELSLVELRSFAPQFAADPVHVPGSLDKFGLGFAINSKAVEGGRAAGSLSWAGIFNTFFWIDPSRKTCAVILMQTLPFSDETMNWVVEHFERAVYATH